MNLFHNKYLHFLLGATCLIVLINLIFTWGRLISDDPMTYKLMIITINIGFSFILISLFSIYRFFFIPFYIIFLFFGALLGYFNFIFGIKLNVYLLECTFNTNFEEASTFFDFNLVLWLVFLWLIPSILLIKYRNLLKIKLKKKFKITFYSIVGGLLILYIPMVFINKINPIVFQQHLLATDLYPSNLFANLKIYNKHKFFKKNKDKVDILSNYNFTFDDKDIKIVLILGESARNDKFALNGYKRNTTPNLSKVSGLVSFKNSYSLATYTIAGLKNIFRINPNKNETNLISIFNTLKFKTYWISAQSFVDDINLIASEAQNMLTKEIVIHKTKIPLRDENLLIPLQEELKKPDNSLIILHTLGSHRTYDDRYTENFNKYKPTCSNINEKSLFKKLFKRNSCYTKKEAGNSYDNSILYTDYFLSEVIKELQGHKAMMIYISDHGESLGENGIYSHSHEYTTAPKEQLHIPYMLWFSDKMLKEPGIQENINKAEKNQNIKIDQSTVIHSILDCINVKSEFIDKRKSICSSELGKGIVFAQR
ncbi:MAG: glucan phosphoethanolaminetransferase (alkaline phosphatase superfamily) [Candidatus Midichloriaceae bacterium]|jgi:glucan phosphoethanolaminetransferase (alkaline phosphatase superfamily)